MGSMFGGAPRHDAGEMSVRTKRLRPDIGLTNEEIAAIRRSRKTGATAWAIAKVYDLPIEKVEKAILAIRTPKRNASRGSLNVNLPTHDFVHAQRGPGEPVWECAARLCEELVNLRQEREELRAEITRLRNLQDDV